METSGKEQENTPPNVELVGRLTRESIPHRKGASIARPASSLSLSPAVLAAGSSLVGALPVVPKSQ
jgi:hypothetical protein